MKAKLLVGAVMALFCVSTANAVFFDDFESYADTAAMLAPTAWGADGGTAQAHLVPANEPTYNPGNPGQAMLHFGLTTAKRVFAPLYASDAQPIVWETDFYDGNGASRNTLGLRTNGGGAALTGLLEMGVYNSIYNPETGLGVAGYGFRTAFVGGPANAFQGWVTFDTNPARAAGWHHMRATIMGTSMLFELDLNRDGIIDGQRLVTVNDQTTNPWNVARLGGPSDVSSVGPLTFDNVSVAQVPEPATLALLGLSGLFLRRRRA